MNKKILTLILVAFSVSCSSGESLVATGNESPGQKELVINVIHHGSKDEEGHYPDYTQSDGTRVFQNAEGNIITLTQALISYKNFDLISEGSDEECESGFDTTILLSVTENVLDDDLEEITLVTTNITDRAYCQYSMNIESVTVKGSFDNGTESNDFEIVMTTPILIDDVFKVLTDGVTQEHALHYHDDETTKTITFGNKYDVWFDGINFTETDEEMGQKLSDNIKNSFHQHLHDTSMTHTH